MGLKYVPTLYPSDEEFQNFIEYLSSPKIKALGDEYGMVKISPPSSFKPPLSINQEKFKFTPRIQKLKELNITNRCRLFFYKQLFNFNKMNKKSLPKDTFILVNNDSKKLFYYDFFIEVIKFYKQKQHGSISGKTLPNIKSSILNSDESLWSYLSYQFQIDIETLKTIYQTKLSSYFNFLSAKPEFTNQLIQEKYPSSLLYDQSDEEDSNSSDNETDEDACLICKTNSHPQDTLLCDSCDKPFHRYCLSPPLSKIPQDNWYCDNCVIGNGYYGFKDSTIQYSLKDFKQLSDDFDNSYFPNDSKPKSIDLLEKQFWSLVDDIDNDLKVNYGADIHNLRKGEISGFPTRDYKPTNIKSQEQYDHYVSHPMNLNNLPYNSKSLLNFLDVDISGMTIPWIYIGNTFSTFCWHVEDQYTLSANYQHLGSTKKWYSIPSKHAELFENYMKNLAPDLFAKQPDILHQLITLVSPFELNQVGIDCFSADQEPGEYIITYPRVYHAGFNAGFNFNEAVNFTMNDWLDFGVESTKNYKKNLDKVSVFDIYEMILNILNHANLNNKFDKGLVLKALEFLKPRLTDEVSLQSTIMEKLDSKPIIPKNIRTIPIEIHGEDIEEDGILCSQCKGFCTFSYILHYEPIPNHAESIQLPTPRSSPENLTDSSKQRRSSKRIKLLKDQEYYKPVILCLEDYLKKDNVVSEKDQIYLIRDVEKCKTLINDVQLKLNSVGAH
ncbi:hypothetical protein BN7_4416 [Wickerhamomyces ciferrii]|uniref:Histone demethylase JHD2 n=1 Tax=Wickerhamomyces ciferrii (strain ATCC 14091 / BCRC 22168 / CBS 111 / JCM 3599 / NBRC 0793 / NRRL Y-1031 F-60-10) TaxID=1206466 RepID=K0KS75_WICCF|nr:uncharacterized protein BN7_4416 [Wickerhamomyces ciferrii]CCH44847.1 hypothetical protein BN7_4416 [Wickerhamomyces ciferrii]